MEHMPDVKPRKTYVYTLNILFPVNQMQLQLMRVVIMRN